MRKLVAYWFRSNLAQLLQATLPSFVTSKPLAVAPRSEVAEADCTERECVHLERSKWEATRGTKQKVRKLKKEINCLILQEEKDPTLSLTFLAPADVTLREGRRIPL